jgi:SAM-dependent methyltransferase
MRKFYEYSCKKHNEWKLKGLAHDKNCPICNSNNVKLVLDKADVDCSKYNKCLDCEFVYANPFPLEDYYNEIYISGYDGLDAWWYQRKETHGVNKALLNAPYPMLDLLRKRKKGGLFLDYGCGTGWVLNHAQHTYDVYGVDLDDFRIKEARELLGDVEGKKIINLNELDDSYFKDKFDVIHSNQNLEHLLEPMRYLKKFYEWLKPGGILYIASPCSDSFAFSFLGKINSMAVLSHVSLFNKNSLTYALRSVGFEQIEYVNTSLDVSATEFWKKIFNINFIHRHSFIENKYIIAILYPLMLLTTATLKVFTLSGILKGNYFYAFAKKPE